jgi:hypothetical protein
MCLSPQGDLGGRKTLQQRWTTFLKADLLCPGPEHGRASSVLQDMAELQPEPGAGTPVFYGIFSSQWWGVLVWSRVTGWETRGVGIVGAVSFRVDGLSPPWLCSSNAFLESHLIWQGMSCYHLAPCRCLVPTCVSSREGAAVSALCAFQPQDIRAALNGPFRELKHDCNRGLPIMENEVPQPRPGEVRGSGQA